MTAPQVPGTPPAPPSPPPPAAAEPAREIPIEPDSGGDGGEVDEVSVARAKAREILFAKEEPAEETEGEEKPKAKAKTEEPKKPEAAPKEEPKDELDLSKKYAKLHDQETRLKNRQKEYLAEKEAFTVEKEAVLKAKAELDEARNNPVEFLSKAGWTRDQIVEWIKGDGKVDPEILVKQLDERYRKEIDDLRAQSAKERTAYEDAQRQRKMAEVETELRTMAKHLWESDAELAAVKRLVEKNPKKFEAFVQSRVEQVIGAVWRQHKKAVDPRDALLYVQQELVELQLSDPGQVPAVKSATPVAVEPTPITNSSTSQRVVQRVDYDESDPEQRRERAAAILRGEIEAE